MEEVKRKRGRPRKNPVIVEEQIKVTLPTTIEEIIEEVKNKSDIEYVKVENEVKEAHKSEWDFKRDDEIKYFDVNYSYELTGYKPINKTKGLDFNPEWFTEARERKRNTGHYCSYPKNTKAYGDFWDEEYRRCRDGLTVNGYTITGDNYFFLNYYQLMDSTKVQKSAGGRSIDFPKFTVSQYEYFHYLELAKQLHKDACLMKARGLGFSEMNASLAANLYNSRRETETMIACKVKGKLDPTINKIWRELSYLNENTDGGFFKLRQVIDQAYVKKASVYKIQNGQKVETGWKSQIKGVVADTPDKIRGEREDLLIFEEAGSWDDLLKAYLQGDALVNINGIRHGLRLLGGTGGDKSNALSGLKEIYTYPDKYNVLPFRHSFTPSGDTVLTGYFLPAFSLVLLPGFIDERGWCDPERAKKKLDEDRSALADRPKALLIHCAEKCYTSEEAFSLEGDNQFDKIIIAEQLAKIRLLKTAPNLQTGTLKYLYRTSTHKRENITGIKWETNLNSKLQILEHPVWSEEYAKQQEEIKKDFEQRGEEYVIPDYSEMNNLYVAGIDSIDIGQEDTSENTDNPSKFCIIIMKRAFGGGDPIPVAIYKDRPEHIRDAYRIAMCLVEYYKAIVNIEATRMNLVSWARENGYYKYFMMRPRATYPDPNKIGKRTPGTPGTPHIIEHQLQLISAYIEDYGYNIWFQEMLEELQSYSYENKTKYDIVAAFGMTLLANEELGNVVATKIVSQQDDWQDLGYYKDENGITHWGLIPKKQKSDININLYYDGTLGTRSSRSFDWDDLVAGI